MLIGFNTCAPRHVEGFAADMQFEKWRYAVDVFYVRGGFSLCSLPY
jgi:hypothetical protein